MIKASYTDKNLVADILAKSFENNQSINYIIKQDKKRMQRIYSLINYSFEICYEHGDVFLSDDKKGCVLVTYPDQKKTTLKSIFGDLKLILSSIGLKNIKKTLARESIINKIQPKELKYYLWFIGVDPEYQNKGIGTLLLKEIILDSVIKERPIYLETSTLKNLPWYQKFGFEIYRELDLSYKLYFLKKELIKKQD